MSGDDEQVGVGVAGRRQRALRRGGESAGGSGPAVCMPCRDCRRRRRSWGDWSWTATTAIERSADL
ncbi:hypothetical protein, partial [Haloarcula sp. CBA1122]|uniref:hypothetical protein n=1 Tax=Haloarcula sp. CBA1122 TaxID=2668069 RepID=UPI002090776E